MIGHYVFNVHNGAEIEFTATAQSAFCIFIALGSQIQGLRDVTAGPDCGPQYQGPAGTKEYRAYLDETIV